MKTKIELDLKSLVLGAAAAAVVIFGAGAASGSSDHGPYQLRIGLNGTTALVNTQTGQVWTAVIRESDGQAIGLSGFIQAKEH